MKHIVLVNPPLRLEERYGDLARAGSTMPSLGLAWLAAACRKNGYDVAIIDAASGMSTGAEIVERIAGYGPGFVGITAMTSSIDSAALLALKIKERDPRLRLLVGGPHVTALPLETMRTFPQFDVGFIGEAELTLVDYLKSADAGAKPETVNGIVFRDHGEIRRTAERPFIEDLDSLPLPAWDLLPGFPGRYAPAAIRCRRLPAGHIVASRGCPMQCSFCDRSVFGSRYRFFSVEYTGEMIDLLTKRFGVRDILFEDDSFTLHRKRVMALCELLCRKHPGLSWSCLGRVDAIDAELLSLMKRAGCWQIGFGIESGNAGVLEGVEKKTNLERIRETLSLTRAAGIHTKGFFILGLPHETEETIRETICFARKSALDDISVSFATPFQGTALHDQAAAFGEFTPDWKKMNLLNVVFVPKGLSKKILEQAHSKFLRRFYFRLRVVADYFLRGLKDWNVFVKSIKGLVSLLGSFWNDNLFPDFKNPFGGGS